MMGDRSARGGIDVLQDPGSLAATRKVCSRRDQTVTLVTSPVMVPFAEGQSPARAVRPAPYWTSRERMSCSAPNEIQTSGTGDTVDVSFVFPITVEIFRDLPMTSPAPFDVDFGTPQNYGDRQLREGG